jgi:hypothetical protein
MNRDSVVYAHYRADDGLMFYVGIGMDYRPYQGGNERNAYWCNTASKHGLRVEVLLSDLTWSEACAVEVEMIAAFRSGVGQQWARLTNLTDGGEGTKGYKFTEEQRARHAEAVRKAAADPEHRANVVKANRKRSENPEWRARNAEKNRKLAADPEWRAKNAEGVIRATIKREADPHYRQRTLMGYALRYATAPHTRLLPSVYRWLYKWHVDGKVYAR